MELCVQLLLFLMGESDWCKGLRIENAPEDEHGYKDGGCYCDNDDEGYVFTRKFFVLQLLLHVFPPHVYQVEYVCIPLSIWQGNRDYT